MKRKFIKVVLALSLVLNPMAVLTAGFHEFGTHSDDAPEMALCHPADERQMMMDSNAPEGKGCDLSCCATMNCEEQGGCVLHHCSAALLRNAPNIAPIPPFRIRTGYLGQVPELETPPENPPPIRG